MGLPRAKKATGLMSKVGYFTEGCPVPAGPTCNKITLMLDEMIVLGNSLCLTVGTN